MIKVLNEAHRYKKIVYLSNPIEEIPDPSSDDICEELDRSRWEEVLTPNEIKMWTSIKTDFIGKPYLLRMGKEAAIGLSYIFDEYWFSEIYYDFSHGIWPDAKMWEARKPMLLSAITKVAKHFIQPKVEDLDIYIGDEIIPDESEFSDDYSNDGFKLMVVIPYEERKLINSTIIKRIDKDVQIFVRRLFTKKIWIEGMSEQETRDELEEFVEILVNEGYRKKKICTTLIESGITTNFIAKYFGDEAAKKMREACSKYKLDKYLTELIALEGKGGIKRVATRICWDVDYDKDFNYLPTDIPIPDEMLDEDETTNYLSDLTGFCHQGYEIQYEEV